MLTYFRENYQFYLLLLLWALAGYVSEPLAFIIIPLSMFYFKSRRMYDQLLIGFFFILIISDNDTFAFARNVKVLYLLILAMFYYSSRDEFKTKNSFSIFFMPFFLMAIFCILFSPVVGIAAQKTMSYILMFLLIPLYFNKSIDDNGFIGMRNMMYFSIGILFVGFLLYFINRDFVVLIKIGRYRGIFGNPNGLGLYTLLLFILFKTIETLRVDLFSRTDKIVIYSMFAFSVLMCGSRNALLSIVILLCLSFFYKKSIFLGIVFSIIFGGIYFLIEGEVGTIIQQLGLEEIMRTKTLDKLGGRTVAWDFAWKNIQKSLFVGKGFGFDERLMRANSDMLSKMGTQGGVHSSYFSLMLNFGLIGLILYLAGYFIFYIRASFSYNIALPIMIVVLFSAAVEGLFIGSLNPQMIILLMTMTILNNPNFIKAPEEYQKVQIEE